MASTCRTCGLERDYVLDTWESVGHVVCAGSIHPQFGGHLTDEELVWYCRGKVAAARAEERSYRERRHFDLQNTRCRFCRASLITAITHSHEPLPYPVPADYPHECPGYLLTGSDGKPAGWDNVVRWRKEVDGG